MERRTFLKLAGVGMLGQAAGAMAENPIGMDPNHPGGALDLRKTAVLISKAASAREKMAAQVLVEEAQKRDGISWPISSSGGTGARVTIALATRASRGKLDEKFDLPESELDRLKPEGFLLATGAGKDGGTWIAVIGADERGLLYGTGKLLRLIDFRRWAVSLPQGSLPVTSSPKYSLRGHQLGYRPKTNAYDGWDVPMWDQYIRDLAIFGANAIELIPSHSDDLPNSPQFPLPPQEMMVKMSQIADNYGLEVWVWYPAMAKDYSNPQTVTAAITEWAQVLRDLPRLDAVFVPGGDPGHTEPKYLLGMMEKQKASLTRVHPKMQMWVSPQGFSKDWMTEFLNIIRQPQTQSWLDGVVFGPQSRLDPQQFRKAVPQRYPIRFYPDITHSLSCQYPVPNWDQPFALTEGREVINPRPTEEANILRLGLPGTIGFLTYSEGCNDDVNKCVWSSLGWDPERPISDVLRDFSRYFIGSEQEAGFAQTLLDLEQDWRGSLAANEHVNTALAAFRDMEDKAMPAVLENWRWQQAAYRVNYDAYVRRRLLEEMGQLARAKDVLGRVNEFGWSALPLHIGGTPSAAPANQLNPSALIDAAVAILDEPLRDPEARVLRTRIEELGYALFVSIHMQLAVERYQGEAVNRGANLDTLETPLTDGPWMRRNLLEIKAMKDPDSQVTAIRKLLTRTDPGPGGFYDELGNIANRPHLVPGLGPERDPAFRHTPELGFWYPDRGGDKVPMAWKHWAGSLYDAPLQMRYKDLDPTLGYRVRIVYSGSGPHYKIRLQANKNTQIHPYITRAWPPAPQEFSIPRAATASGALTLSWTREPGLGHDGTGCQVAEVWLFPEPPAAVSSETGVARS